MSKSDTNNMCSQLTQTEHNNVWQQIYHYYFKSDMFIMSKVICIKYYFSVFKSFSYLSQTENMEK